MRINTSTGYAFLAIGYIARNQDKGLVWSYDIANKYNIPVEYLFKIMQELVKANILRSKRGPRGGFALARKPSSITMLDVIEAVEGPLSGALMLAEHAPKDRFVTRANKTSENAYEQARKALKAIKISQLL